MENWLFNGRGLRPAQRPERIYSVWGNRSSEGFENPSNLILYESNEKTLNELYFSTVGKGNYRLTPSQQTTVLNIANQCPYTGGEAVYRARAMRLLFEPEYQYSDSVVCGLQNIGWRKKANNPTKSAIQHWVIPNPTSGNVLLQLSDGVKEDTECKVYDIQGRVVSVVPVSAGVSQIHLSLKGLSYGVYYYSLFTEGKHLDGKIILIK